MLPGGSGLDLWWLIYSLFFHSSCDRWVVVGYCCGKLVVVGCCNYYCRIIPIVMPLSTLRHLANPLVGAGLSSMPRHKAFLAKFFLPHQCQPVLYWHASERGALVKDVFSAALGKCEGTPFGLGAGCLWLCSKRLLLSLTWMMTWRMFWLTCCG